MGMTATQKILARGAARGRVAPGDLIEARLDLVLGNDITAPPAIAAFREMGAAHVFDPDKVVLVPDHFTPNKDIASAEQAKTLRLFAKEQGCRYFEVGRMGIEHALLPEQGLVAPGEIIIGADSHTCTYGALGAFSTGVGSTDMAAAMALGTSWFRVPEAIRVALTGAPRDYVTGKDVILHLIGLIGVDGARYMSLEFTGDGIRHLSIDSRLSMANMAIEAGAKNGFFEVDEAAIAYLARRVQRPYTVFAPDADAEYARTVAIDLGQVPLTVAMPSLPENACSAADVDQKVDQVIIGSCTNGREEDLRIAAGLLKGRSVHPDVRCIVFPATQGIYRTAIREGWIDDLIRAGCAVSTPTCGPCLGGHCGILADGEVCLATTNRNFVGRMGHPNSKVILAGPAVAAATAVMGRVATPDQLKGGAA